MPLRDPRGEGLGGPLLMALALHLGVALLLLVGGWLQRPPEVVSVAGPVLDATLVISTADISAAEQTAEAAPKPAPRAEL
ncbi:MAG TPA: protein TolA, partial [Arenimonas sp.]|nr:protein TolA [Arenimonas sp.]